MGYESLPAQGADLVCTLPLHALGRQMAAGREVTMTNCERTRPEERPSIVLTESDRETLFRLLRELEVSNTETACLLRQEIERADIIPEGVASNSVVRIGCNVKFVEHANPHVRRAHLVLPEKAGGNDYISVLSPIGTALIGLGPGQSICWMEHGRERSLAVLDVRASGSPHTEFEAKRGRHRQR
jgi:regulator of nucleoside diphosphate kinase